MLNYKGYIGKAEYDEDAHIFSGTVINTRTVITFQGTSVDELENEFRASVDDYINWCREDGISPEKPYSGRFNVRISPEIHEKAAIKASMIGVSLNSFVESAIKAALT